MPHLNNFGDPNYFANSSAVALPFLQSRPLRPLSCFLQHPRSGRHQCNAANQRQFLLVSEYVQDHPYHHWENLAQLALGVPLEMVHGGLRVAAVYVSGVLAGGPGGCHAYDVDDDVDVDGHDAEGFFLYKLLCVAQYKYEHIYLQENNCKKIQTWGYSSGLLVSARTGIPPRRTASKNSGQRSSGIVEQKSLAMNLVAMGTMVMVRLERWSNFCGDANGTGLLF